MRGAPAVRTAPRRSRHAGAIAWLGGRSPIADFDFGGLQIGDRCAVGVHRDEIHGGPAGRSLAIWDWRADSAPAQPWRQPRRLPNGDDSRERA